MSGITKLINNINLPRFVKVHQIFEHNELTQEQILKILKDGFEKQGIKGKIKPGQRICITCGSRGVSNMNFITKTLVNYIREQHAEPFLIPTMGSHGGATGEGQKKILESLGITEESMGCPILSSMETVKISHVEDFDVCIDKNAYEADGIIVLNRVKAHTSFQGPYESGLMKMMTIGLGKQYGAHICHSKGDDSMSHRIGLNGREVIKHTNVIMGVALLENSFDKTFDVKVLTDKEIPEEEPKLLERAKKAMGRIWLDSCDTLIVRSIGKNYTGAGMDPNIVGRCVNPKLKMGITSKRIGILDLSDESHGNATGMGRADFAPMRFYKKLSFDDTYPNAITSYDTTAYRIPVIVDSDEEVLKACVASSLGIDYENPRIIIINNSLEIEDILISESMIKEAENIKQLSIQSEPFSLEFDLKGNLITQF
ncbi:MAG: DUF362 domain-containing protein [Clostridia bacterium]|jgi:hypothetical protein|nr:DUF362 domain-containing protein [Clostridia bacterium]MCI2000495.1 DUF362 domain-containing protein [Clostridia bacterium]MCI2014950.1 DUF362 domain-containing protein [Clostridia bacterium]